jgi:N utilization substance protein A
MGIRLSTEGIRYLTIFESITGASVKDCVVDEDNDKIIFVVKKGEMGLAIGRGGSNINRVKKLLGKKIEIVEHSDDVVEFLENIFKPIKVKVSMTERNGKKVAIVNVDFKDKGLAIGKDGKNINKAKVLVSRHHDVDDVVIR